MQTIHYSMPRLVFVFLAMFGMVILGAWVNIRMENGGGFYGYLIMLGGIISVPDVLRMMLNGGKILEFDHNFVTYHKLLGPAQSQVGRGNQHRGGRTDGQFFNEPHAQDQRAIRTFRTSPYC